MSCDGYTWDQMTEAVQLLGKLSDFARNNLEIHVISCEDCEELYEQVCIWLKSVEITTLGSEDMEVLELDEEREPVQTWDRDELSLETAIPTPMSDEEIDKFLKQ